MLQVNIIPTVTDNTIRLSVSGTGEGLTSFDLVLECDFGKRAVAGDPVTENVDEAQLISAVAVNREVIVADNVAGTLPKDERGSIRQYKCSDYACNVAVTVRNGKVDGPLFDVVIPYAGSLIAAPAVRLRKVLPFQTGASGPDPDRRAGEVGIIQIPVIGAQRVFKVNR